MSRPIHGADRSHAVSGSDSDSFESARSDVESRASSAASRGIATGVSATGPIGGRSAASASAHGPIGSPGYRTAAKRRRAAHGVSASVPIPRSRGAGEVHGVSARGVGIGGIAAGASATGPVGGPSRGEAEVTVEEDADSTIGMTGTRSATPTGSTALTAAKHASSTAATITKTDEKIKLYMVRGASGSLQEAEAKAFEKEFTGKIQEFQKLFGQESAPHFFFYFNRDVLEIETKDTPPKKTTINLSDKEAVKKALEGRFDALHEEYKKTDPTPPVLSDDAFKEKVVGDFLKFYDELKVKVFKQFKLQNFTRSSYTGDIRGASGASLGINRPPSMTLPDGFKAIKKDVMALPDVVELIKGRGAGAQEKIEKKIEAVVSAAEHMKKDHVETLKKLRADAANPAKTSAEKDTIEAQIKQMETLLEEANRLDPFAMAVVAALAPTDSELAAHAIADKDPKDEARKLADSVAKNIDAYLIAKWDGENINTTFQKFKQRFPYTTKPSTDGRPVLAFSEYAKDVAGIAFALYSKTDAYLPTQAYQDWCSEHAATPKGPDVLGDKLVRDAIKYVDDGSSVAPSFDDYATVGKFEQVPNEVKTAFNNVFTPVAEKAKWWKFFG